MFSFGRFLISLVVIIAVFCFAWCIGDPKNKSDQTAEGESVSKADQVSDQVSTAGHPTRATTEETTQNSDSKQQKSSNLWDNKGLDLSKIAIKDPFADQSNQISDSDPATNNPRNGNLKSIEPKQNSTWNADADKKAESFVVDPPPLVGNFSTPDAKDEKSSDSTWGEQPAIPKLLTLGDSKTKLDSADDPNAPPPPIQEDNNSAPILRRMPTVLSQKTPKPLHQQTPGRGQQFVGELVVVEKKQLSKTKPIGFVKHVWKHGDSLPDLAELYLNDKNRYMEIVAINGEDISNPTKIPIGTVLKIPVY